MARKAPIAMTVPRQYRNSRLDRSSTCDAPLEIEPAPKYLLCGPDFGDTTAPWEFYLPAFKTTEIGDIWTTCWLGLSPARAEELSIWKHLLKTCLLKTIIPLPHQRPRDGLQNGFLSRTIPLPPLVVEMVDSYTFDGYDRTARGTRYDWFTSAPNVYHRVEQFVRLHGCFNSLRPGSGTVAVQFRATHSDSAAMTWHPSYYLSFDGLETTAAPGKYYVLKPRCHANDGSALTVAYMTSCNWLEWDKKSASFVGIVPRRWTTPESYITVHAVNVQEFGEGVRFKQAIRTRVTIPVQMPEVQVYSGLLEGGPLNKSGSLSDSEACHESGSPRQHCLRPDLVREDSLSPQLPSHTEVLMQRELNRIVGDFVFVKQTPPCLDSDNLEQSQEGLHEAVGTVETVQFRVADDSQDIREMVGRNGFDWRGLEF